MSEHASSPPVRPEIDLTPDTSGFGVVERPLGLWERLADNGVFRKTVLLVVLAAVWEAYARWLDNSLLFPSFGATVEALWDGIVSGRILFAAFTSIKVLLQGYAAGIACAAVLTALASATRVGADLLETLTSMFNPLPSIALLPLALIWFGFGDRSIVFVLVHAVLWAVALNTHAGFRGVSTTWRMVGRNCGLSGLGYVGANPHPRRLPEHPDRAQDRLGLRLAHPDRGRAGVRRQLGGRRARLVHLREQELPRHRLGLRRPPHRDPVRTAGGERGLRHHRAPHSATLGHADVRKERARRQGAKDSDMVSSESDTGHVERALTRFAVGLDLTDVPAAVAHQGRRALVNIVATSFAGCREPAVDTALRVLSPYSSGGRVALLGRRETADMLLAAFVNAMAANIHDFDDTHPATIIHPSAPVVPALAALAQTRRTAGRAFLAAFLAGAEALCRIGNAVYPSHYVRGWHITSTCGVFGSALGASSLLGLDAEAAGWAIGNAAAQSSGMVQALGTMSKSISVGGAARNGLLAALLAREGFSGPDDTLSGSSRLP